MAGGEEDGRGCDDILNEIGELAGRVVVENEGVELGVCERVELLRAGGVAVNVKRERRESSAD